MPLASGTSLGPYTIESPLGAGGMGEVYRARDTRLDRTVAIKVLPEHVAADPDLQQRFEREAKTISSLNHPHICTLYDIGNQDGIDFLVMEYLDGETLAQRLEKGALPLDQALQIAIEIADALDKAHRQGIVHRDLKPGNIMLTKTGARLLDFGLAKLRPVGAAPGVSAMPTQSAGLTGEGSILGTLQYMAPEQLEGKEADARTDIFAFGTTVYEMATGKKPFEGTSQASLIGAILKDEPRPLSALQPLSPAPLDRVVRKSLTKDPDRRWQTAQDLHDELQWIAEAGAQVGVSTSTLAAPEQAGWRRALPWMLATLAVGGTLIGLTVWTLARPTPTPRSLARFVVTTPPEGPVGTGPYAGVAVSPDGTQIVYASGQSAEADRRLYVRKIDQLEATPLRGAEGGNTPFFSPDGESVGFTLPGDILKRVSVFGGPAVTIGELGAGPRGMSWGPDDSIVYATTATKGLTRVPALGGEPEVLTTVDAEQEGETDHYWPEVLPNGRGVLFTAWSGSVDASRLAVVSLESREITYLLPGGSNPRYSPTGHIVYSVGGALRAIGFDAERLELTSNNPVPVLENVRTTVIGAASFGLADNGSLVYVAGFDETSSGPENTTLVWLDRRGREEPVGAPPGRYGRPRVSPDGTRLAVDAEDQGNQDVWIYDLAQGTSTRLTFDPAADNSSLWAPTGERVVFASDREDAGLFWKAADGTGPVERLTTTATYQRPYGWAGDGQVLVFYQGPPPADIGVVSLEGESTQETLLPTPVNEGRPALSPGGRWIAYHSNESGRDEIYVQPFPDLDGKWQVSTTGGRSPVWGPEGRELFYRNVDEILAVPIDTQGGFARGNPEVLFEGQSLRQGGRQYDLAPDGQRFVMIKAGTGDSPSEIIVVQNWHQELLERVPIP